MQAAGAWKVITEAARKCGTAGIFDLSGGMRTELTGEIAMQVSPANVIFEAPSKAASLVHQRVRPIGQPRQHPAGRGDPARDAPARPPRRHAQADPARRRADDDAVAVSRLVRSHLVERAPAAGWSRSFVTSACVHAQVMGSAELQLAAALKRVTQADVREALWSTRARKDVDAPRTLHIHPADELGLWTAARRASTGADHESSLDDIDEIVAGSAMRSVAAADAGGACGCRRRARRVGAARRACSGWGYYLGDAADRRATCSAAAGAKVTFVHLDDWLGPRLRGSRRRRCARSARRYGLRPPSPRGFRKWSPGVARG